MSSPTIRIGHVTPAELASELRDAAASVRRVPSRCLRDGVALVEWHSDLAKRLDRAAELLAPAGRPKSPIAMVPAEGRFTPGTIQAQGRTVRVEIRRKRAA